MYAIEIKNLTKKFPIHKGYKDVFIHPFEIKYKVVLKNINLQVKEGEIFSIIGPNGAGKTTLIKIICSLILPEEGEIFIKNKIGYVVNDERSFFWRLTGFQNIKFFSTLNNIIKDDKIYDILKFLNLYDVKDVLFNNYSTGMKQKLSIARTLITEPDILLIDEPTKSLAPNSAKDIRNLIKELKNRNKTIFFATHNLLEAEELSDRIGILNKGELKAYGTVEELKFKYNKDSMEEVFSLIIKE